MLTDKHIKTVQATIPLLESAGTDITTHFYERMFSHNPELKNIFNMTHQNSGRQPAALFDAIAAYAMNIENPAALTDAVERIAQKHTSFNVQPAQYAVVGHHLIETLRELAGDAFTHDVEEAWTTAYGVLADIFIKREQSLYQENADKKGGWTGERRFRVVSARRESALVNSFELEPVDGESVIAHKPGQYLGLRLSMPEHEWLEVRQYSLSGLPNNKHYRISVKREANEVPGIVSNFLHDQLRVGDEIEAYAPAGDFYLKPSNAEVVLISAGVGLTPMQSMLEQLNADQHSLPVVYLHACQDADQHSFGDRVTELSTLMNLTTHTWYENDTSQSSNAHKGVMDLQAVADDIPVEKGEFYLCGPIAFMQFAKKQLLDLGVDDGRIHYEVFGPHDQF
ncbi:Flavohemoprotein [BD1-7 clade bacterium]|uniref:Flavohemoprotein n=1 Tax=BD1-7 clade bacterium TaxID=2029982 RepID=A0A5S9QWM5_9GAMM|nr:Flavohemoprotein [BD1-7 clade bacterium]